MKSPPSSSSSAAAVTDTTAAAESSMDDNSSDSRRCRSPKSASLTTATLQTTSHLLTEDDAGEFDGGDQAAWAAFTQNFRQVQSVLDRNRVLIQQVNENHQSKMHDNMVKNVSLIQEINGNISKVSSLYSNLSANFSGICQERRDSKRNSEEKQLY